MFTGFRDWDVATLEDGQHSTSHSSTVLCEMKRRGAWGWQAADGHATGAPSSHCRGCPLPCPSYSITDHCHDVNVSREVEKEAGLPPGL